MNLYGNVPSLSLSLPQEKLKTFQKISSRGELGSGGGGGGKGTGASVAEDKKPPPPLKYKDLINVSETFRPLE